MTEQLSTILIDKPTINFCLSVSEPEVSAGFTTVESTLFFAYIRKNSLYLTCPGGMPRSCKARKGQLPPTFLSDSLGVENLCYRCIRFWLNMMDKLSLLEAV